MGSTGAAAKFGQNAAPENETSAPFPYNNHPLETKWPFLSIDKFVGWKRFNFDKDKFGEGF